MTANEPTEVTYPRDQLLFLALGGAGEIGMNLSLYGYGGKWLMVDLGVTFADETMPGIDLLVPDPAFIAERADDLVGLIVTHAHEDHLGAVPWLWQELQCPVWATPFAAHVLRRKLEETGLEKKVPIHIYNPGDVIDLAPFKVTPIGITHSIPESQALAIETPAGLVVHSGDWKLDPQPLVGPESDAAQLKAFGDRGVMALVCDSTNVFKEGESGSEGAVRESLTALLAGRTGRVAVTTFASNVARLETIAQAAAAHDRRVALVGRSLWRITGAARASGYLKDLPDFLTDKDAGYLPDDKVLLLCTGCQGEPRGAMTRIAEGNHPHIALGPKDTAIFSSKIIPGNERQLGRLHNLLAIAGVEVITEKDAFVHVSGHPARDELARMYGWVRPKLAVPVHGEPRHLIEHAKLAKSLGVPETATLRNGQMLQLGPGPVRIVDEVPSGRLAVDGQTLIRPQGAVLTGRRRLMHNGVAFVTLIVDPAGRLIADPQLALHGLGDDDGDEVFNTVLDAIENAVDGLKAREARDDDAIVEAARVAIRRLAKSMFGRRPVVECHVVRLTDTEVATTPSSHRSQEIAR